MSNTDNESESEQEYQYSCCSYKCSYIMTINVAGGGMMNGNAYADLEFHYKTEEDFISNPDEPDKIYYCEYGKNPVRDLLDETTIVWDDEGYNFNLE